MALILGVGTDNGVVVLTPGKPGEAWQLMSQGLNGKAISCLAPHPDGSLYVGASNGSIFRTVDFEKWEARYQGVRYPSIYSLAIDPNNPDLVFCGTCPAALFVSADRGKTFVQIESFNSVEGWDKWSHPEPPHTPRLHRLLLHPQNSQVVLAAVQNGGLYISGDHGQTWHGRSHGLGPAICDLALHPEAPQRLYTTTPIGFCRSDDLGTTWTTHSQGLPYTFKTQLAVAPEDPNVLLMGCHRTRDGGPTIFRTLDGGQNWQVCPGTFPLNPTHRLTAMVAAKGYVIAGTNSGDLMCTTNFGGVWTKLRQSIAGIRSLSIIYQQ